MNDERIALVTGSNKGIGLEVCRQLATRKFMVYLTARRADEGKAACARLQQSGLDVRFLQLDVTDLESVASAAETLRSQADHLDVLVNNAGISLDADQSILEVDPNTVRRTLETNTLGALWVTQKFA